MQSNTEKKEEQDLDIAKNTVSAKAQVKEYDMVRTILRDGNINVLFVGNSITRHAPAEDIGWFGDWGMSASKEENDYVHLIVKALDEKYGKVNYCTASCADWERNYCDDEIMTKWVRARDFNADIIIVRLGENIYPTMVEKSDSNPLYPHLKKFIDYFNYRGNAKIIITDLFWAYAKIDTVLREIAEKNGYEFVHISDLSQQNDNKAIGQFWHSGVAQHPNDNGMKFISQRIMEKL